MESTSATIIPFSLATTCRALSLLIVPPGTEIAGESARSYQLDFTQELGESATLMIHITVRRYVKADRVVFVWRLLAEGQGEFEGMYTDESAWFVLWPMKTHNNYGPAVVLQNYMRLLPIGFDGKSDSDARANRFIEILVKADEVDVKGMKQMMDRLVREKRSC
ncbi:hypothetical protein PHMEG_00031850 [Phytophthora megakarya]|uniref:Uncharacterized protein n=1 Tax=Phytophthora megakarya TaxID=4795 RepID=A0A225UVW1_9STRA|nr:hypothetical protein PHMEG_00031850 [Phytophthora megakarya]